MIRQPDDQDDQANLDATTISRDLAVVEVYVNDPLVHSLATPRLSTELTPAIEWTQAHAAGTQILCLIVHGSADRLVPPEGSRVFYENMGLGVRSGRFARATTTRSSTTSARSGC